jgi:hypothetical protein
MASVVSIPQSELELRSSSQSTYAPQLLQLHDVGAKRGLARAIDREPGGDRLVLGNAGALELQQAVALRE